MMKEEIETLEKTSPNLIAANAYFPSSLQRWYN